MEDETSTNTKHLEPFGQNPSHEPVDVVLVIHQNDRVFLTEVAEVVDVLKVQRAVGARPPLRKECELWTKKISSINPL